MSKLSLIEGSTISRPDPKFWGATAVSKPTSINYTYSIGLFDLVTMKSLTVKGADPAEKYRGSPWFQFPTPPQMYELSEPAATTIVPTQGGGKFIESHGSIIKDIRLSGTVGLRPNPVNSDILPEGLTAVTGVSLSVPKSLDFALKDGRGLPTKEITGFDDITFLRNLFRGYWDLKKSNEWARRTVMIWIYAKDSDIFIVEPTQFSATKEKSNPLSYNYNITLRTLYRFDQSLPKQDDPLSGFQKVANVFNVAVQASRDITTALTQLANAIDYVTALPFRISDTLITEAIMVMSALANLRNTGTRLSDMGQKYIAKLGSDAAEMRKICAILENGIDEQGSRRSVFAQPVDTGFISLTTQATDALLQNEVAKAAMLLLRVADRILAVDAFYSTSKQVIVEDQRAPYNRGGAPFSVGSPLNVNNISIPSSATEDTVGGNETLRDIAKRTMGDESYWKMLAIVNNLKPPYISITKSDGVLTKNDKILIPKRADPGDFSVVSVENSKDVSESLLSPMLRKYGRDLKLSKGSLGTDYSDLEVGQGGDLALIESVDNVRQALMIKVSTEQGELALHSTFGAAYPVGSKVSLSQLQEFALNTRRTLLDDTRVDSILKLVTIADGDVINVSTSVSLRQTDVQLPIEFTVRRA